MGGGAPQPPAPDPNIGIAALRQAELGEQYLKFSKQQFRISTEMQKELNAITKEVSNFFLSTAKEDRDRWQTLFKPLEDQFLAEAKEWSSPEKQAEEAARAKADVQSAAAVQRGATGRQLSAMGVAPDSGRYAGIDRALGLGTALGSVGAQNEARERVRDRGLALKGAAIDLGRGLPGSAGAGMAAGLSAASQPVQMHMASTGIVQPGFQAAMAGHNNRANILNQQYQSQLQGWGMSQRIGAANAAGLGSFLGQIGTAGLGLILSSKQAKTAREPVAEGAALAAVEGMPVEEFDYKPGVGDGGHHVGPMAEDFAQRTGHGDGRTIAVQDAIGVTMGAVKDLSAKVDRIAQAIGLGSQPRAATA